MKKIIILFFLISSSLSFADNQLDICKKKTIQFNNNGVMYLFEVACTQDEQSKGLMFRKELKPNEGMLFVFNDPMVLQFWMKNTYIPLTIIFMDENFKILTIKQMTPHDLTPISSEKIAKYALEVSPNTSLKEEIKVGKYLKLGS